MSCLKLNNPLKRAENTVIGFFDVGTFKCYIYWEPEELLLQKSVLLFLGSVNGAYSIVVSDRFLHLEHKNHELAEMLCFHEAGHVVNNCMVSGGTNLQAEISADTFVFNHINKDKSKMNMMYDKVKSEIIWAKNNLKGIVKKDKSIIVDSDRFEDAIKMIVERKKFFNGIVI